MSNEALETPVVLEPETIPEMVDVPPAPEVKRYEYQPTDEQGRPIGGVQVIKYTTTDELAEKLTEQNTLLIRKLRSETRKNLLGIGDQDEVPGDPLRFQEPVSFNPKSLSAEDQYALARKLGVDPEEFNSATDELFEVKFGVKPDVLRQTLTDLQEERYNSRALAECNAFIRVNPNYVACPENHEAITSWMIKKKLAPVQDNFQLAYDTLTAKNALITNFFETVEEPEPVVEVVAPAVVAPAVVAPAVVAPAEPVAELPVPELEFKPAGLPTGFTRETTTDQGTAPNIGETIIFDVVQNGQRRRFTGLAAIKAMPADEYRHRSRDANFVRLEAALEKEAADRRRNRH